MRFKQETKSILIHAPPYLCAPSFLREKKVSRETSPMHQEGSHPDMPCPDISHPFWICIDGWIQIWMKNQPKLLQPPYLYLSTRIFDSEWCKLNRDIFWACKHKRKVRNSICEPSSTWRKILKIEKRAPEKKVRRVLGECAILGF